MSFLQTISPMLPENDVARFLNTTTLGPYSFRVFVSVAWTKKHIAEGEMPRGRRPSLKFLDFNRKRPLAKDIAKEPTRPAKRRKTGSNENNGDSILIIGQMDRRTTRSQTK